MVAGKKIEEYRVIIYGQTSGIDANHRSTILLYDDKSHCVGRIRFSDPETPLPKDFEKYGTIRMFLYSDMFLNVVDILRNEKPIFLHGSPGEYYISTEKEPVGEEEKD